MDVQLREDFQPLECLIARARRHDHGQDLLEYALLAALIAVVAIGAVNQLGETISTVFWDTIATAAGLV